MVSQSPWPALIEQAPAKVNLFLRVVRKRADGFHDLETVMAKLPDLADTLRFELLPTGELLLDVIPAYPTSLGTIPIPATADNLVIRAAAALQTASGCSLGARITLVKRIPAAAGLGGGSSDAASTLRALNRLWQTGFKDQQLADLAASLGSDVPFFLAKSAWALCTGRGEILTPLPRGQRLPLVLARPSEGLSTPAVYRACTPEPAGPSVENFLRACDSHRPGSMAHCLHNSLQPPAERLNPQVGWLKQVFEREGVIAHLMTGSGSAYFGICHSLRQACCIAGRLRNQGVSWVQVASTTA